MITVIVYGSLHIAAWVSKTKIIHYDKLSMDKNCKWALVLERQWVPAYIGINQTIWFEITIKNELSIFSIIVNLI